MYNVTKIKLKTRNILDCVQSNYSSCIIFSHTLTLEPNTNSIGWTVSEIWPFEIFQDARSVVGRSVGRFSIYTLMSCTPLRYVSARGVKTVQFAIKANKVISISSEVNRPTVYTVACLHPHTASASASACLLINYSAIWAVSWDAATNNSPFSSPARA